MLLLGSRGVIKRHDVQAFGRIDTALMSIASPLSVLVTFDGAMQPIWRPQRLQLDDDGTAKVKDGGLKPF